MNNSVPKTCHTNAGVRISTKISGASANRSTVRKLGRFSQSSLRMAISSPSEKSLFADFAALQNLRPLLVHFRLQLLDDVAVLWAEEMAEAPLCL